MKLPKVVPTIEPPSSINHSNKVSKLKFTLNLKKFSLEKKRPASTSFPDEMMETSTSHHYRPPFGKSPVAQVPPEPLAFRTARDQLEIEEAKTKGNLGGSGAGGVVKKSLGMHSSAK